MIRVLLADDQALIRAGFRMLLTATDDIDVVGEAGDGAEAVQLAASTRADVVLMDIRMPGVDGLEATRRIAANDDLAGVRVLILTTYEADDYVYQALRAGAAGFLIKDTVPADLVHAVRVVAAGDALLSHADIAAKLFLSPLTAKTHVSRIMTKLEAHDRAQLVIAAHESGLITPGVRSDDLPN